MTNWPMVLNTPFRCGRVQLPGRMLVYRPTGGVNLARSAPIGTDRSAVTKDRAPRLTPSTSVRRDMVGYDGGWKMITHEERMRQLRLGNAAMMSALVDPVRRGGAR